MQCTASLVNFDHASKQGQSRPIGGRASLIGTPCNHFIPVVKQHVKCKICCTTTVICSSLGMSSWEHSSRRQTQFWFSVDRHFCSLLRSLDDDTDWCELLIGAALSSKRNASHHKPVGDQRASIWRWPSVYNFKGLSQRSSIMCKLIDLKLTQCGKIKCLPLPKIIQIK